MNNDQFRKLVSDTPRANRSQDGTTKTSSSGGPALGSRQRGFMPMTPRSLGGTNNSNDFARQVAAHRAAQNGTQQQQNKPRKQRAVAPLGSKLPEGYIDRAKAIRDAEAAEAATVNSSQVDGDEATPTRPAPKDDNEKRLFAIMDLVREGKMDKDTAIEQTKLLGGDVSSTHLVKGLDFALLNRARRGEDLLGNVVIGKEGLGLGVETDKTGQALDKEVGVSMDIDDELDKALEKEVLVTTREKKEEKVDDDDDAAAAVAIPKKKTRREIMDDLRKSRAAAATSVTPPAPVLSSKFKKISEKVHKTKKSKQNGNTNTQHVDKKMKMSESAKVTDIDITKPVLGMLPPALPASATKNVDNVEDEDEDIFADAGAEYDPLAGIISDEDDDDDSSDNNNDHKGEKEQEESIRKGTITTGATTSQPPLSSSIPDSTATSMPPPPPPPTPSLATAISSSLSSERPRNYFSSPSTASSTTTTPINPLDNSDLLAAIKKASLLSAAEVAVNKQKEQQQPSAKHQAMLSSSRRDDADVDMGFGGSRTFGDDDDDDEGPVEDEDGGGGKGKGKKRKRKKSNKV